jgi:hypothetical protein
MTIRDLQNYQEEYSNQPFEKHQVAFRKRKILELIKKHNHQNLLEVGAGLESIFLVLDTFRRLTVVEPAQMFFEKAQQDSVRSINKNIQLVNCMLEALPPDKFDFILVSALLHEVIEPDCFLETVRNFCSATTVVHINVPNARSFHRLLAVKMGLIKSEFQLSNVNIKLQQPRVYDLAMLQQTVTEQGFKVLESGTYFLKPFPHLLMQQLLDSQLISEEMIEGFYRMEEYLPNLGSEIFVNIQKN